MTSIIIFIAGFAAGYFFDAYVWPFIKRQWAALQKWKAERKARAP